VINSNMVIVPHPPYLLDLAPLWFRFVSQIENETEGMTFWNCPKFKGNRKQYSTALRKWLPQCYRSVEKMMGLLYTFPRRLFWMRWQPKLSKLGQYFFFDLVWELTDSTS
jgi:hypothetical protein